MSHKWKVIELPTAGPLVESNIREVTAETALEAVQLAFRPNLHANVPAPRPDYLGHGIWSIVVMGTKYYVIEPFDEA